MMAQPAKRQKLDDFTRRQDSLRIAASNVAAVAGFHPWKHLPELFLMDCVYQGSAGKALLRHDAELLGLAIVDDPNEQFRELAAKAGMEDKWKEVVRIKNGSKTVHSVEEATKVKAAIVKEAATKLSKDELKSLQEGVRSAVDTGYGIQHEDAALDEYEEKIGFPVTDRNCEIRSWPFQKTGDTSVSPMAGATAWVPCHVIPGRGRRDASEADKVDPAVEQDEQKPFFYITGSVDGIRDELALVTEEATSSKPVDAEFDDDDNDCITLRSVIVECKHRMHRLRPVPPLYEQIQAIAYMLMYNVHEADILQVLRVGPKVETQEENEEDAKPRASTPEAPRDSSETNNTHLEQEGEGDGTTVKSNAPGSLVRSEEEEQEEKDKSGDTQSHTQPHTCSSNIIISTHRVSLDDPVLRHRHEWGCTILPRLRSFVDAVYRVRSDDGLRYQMLSAFVDSTAPKQAWELLFAQCSWMKTCDTAYFNDRL